MILTCYNSIQQKIGATDWKVFYTCNPQFGSSKSKERSQFALISTSSGRQLCARTVKFTEIGCYKKISIRNYFMHVDCCVKLSMAFTSTKVNGHLDQDYNGFVKLDDQTKPTVS